MAEQVFVGRRRELNRLQMFLDTTMDGKGQMAFITGEAGSGKTALISEFARRAQLLYPGLLVAIGNCNAQTGIGDPYLPFREVLGLLTGDVESKLAQGAITNENAGRLREFLRISGQALVELGPDLIDIFVPGTNLVARAVTFAAGKLEWLDQLKELTERKEASGAGVGLEQGRIFDQYTKVLNALAAQRPLMLFIDDLHWADVSSISLLFHLGRRIGESRILVIGAYRPEDVAVGRAGKAHPLESVASEFKRYFGDIWVDLGQVAGSEGRQFMDALLDTEPNRLGEAFRQALFRRTEGHPLFTVELLRNMRARGDLLQDEEGQWIEGSALDWGALPVRVEGVIEKRIDRLGTKLRDVLTVASVEGEDFTAQVVACVQDIPERQLLGTLSRELGKKHRLVREREEGQVGDQRLSRYRFTHALFQQYVYNQLSAGERRLLHREIGEVLETLYGDQVEDIAVQLGHHFMQGEAWEKAYHYLAYSGERARQAHANHEAIAFYTSAIEVSTRIMPALEKALLFPIYEGRGLAWMMLTKYDEAIEDFHMMRQMARTSEKQQKEGQALFYLANAHFMKFSEDQFLAEEYAQEALRLSRQTGDQRIFAKSLGILGFVHQARADLQKADRMIEESLQISRREGFKDAIAQGHVMLGHQAYWQGNFSRAIQLAQEGVTASREIHDGFNELFNLTLLSQAYESSGRYNLALEVLNEAFEKAKERDNKFFIGRLMNTFGWFHSEFGDFARAEEFDQESVELGRMYRISNVEISALINLGLDYGAQNQHDRALSYLKPTLERVEREAFGAHRWRWKVRLLVGLAEVHCNRGAFGDALRYVEAGLEEARATSSQKYVAKGWGLRGKILAHYGNTEAAGEEIRRAFTLAEHLRCPSLSYPLANELGRWFERAGRKREAAVLYGKAKAIIEHMGATVEDQTLRSIFLQSALVQTILESFARTH